MKKLTNALLSMLLIAATSCKKQNNNIDTTDPKSTPDTSYYIDGLTDIHIKTVGQGYSTINISKNLTTDKKVTVSINGEPKGVKSKFTNASGYPNFIANLRLTAWFIPRGKYPINIVTSAEGSNPKIYSVDLIVDTLTTNSCYHVFRGGYTTVNFTAKSNKVGNSLAGITPTISVDQQQGKNQAMYINTIPLYHEVNTPNNYLFMSSTGLDNNTRPTENHVKFDFDCETGKMLMSNVLVAARTTLHNNVVDTFIVNGTGYVDAEKETYTFKYTSKSKSDPAKEAVEYTLSGNFLIY